MKVVRLRVMEGAVDEPEPGPKSLTFGPGSSPGCAASREPK